MSVGDDGFELVRERPSPTLTRSRKSCDADRLPADKLEDAILAQLVSVLGNQSLVRERSSARTPNSTQTGGRESSQARSRCCRELGDLAVYV